MIYPIQYLIFMFREGKQVFCMLLTSCKIFFTFFLTSISNGAMCITNENGHINNGSGMDIDYRSHSGTKRKSDISISVLNKVNHFKYIMTILCYNSTNNFVLFVMSFYGGKIPCMSLKAATHKKTFKLATSLQQACASLKGA